MDYTYAEENSAYYGNNPTWHIEDSAWKALQIAKIISRNKIHPATIAEVGCGAGEILNQLQQMKIEPGATYSGYEIAPDAFRMCQARVKPGLAFYNEDLLQSTAFYDLLLMIDVFEHVEDYIDFIRQSSLKATFKIYHIPLDMSVSSILRNMPMNARKKVGHLHYFMKDTALVTLKDTGQEIMDWFYTPGSAGLTKNAGYKLRTRILNVPRKILYKINPDITVKLLGGYSLLVLTKQK